MSDTHFVVSPKNSIFRQFWRTPAGWAVFVSTLGVMVYSFWVLRTQYDPQVEEVVSSLGLILLDLLFVIFGFWIFKQKDFELRLRRAWIFLAAGVACNMIAEILWFYYASFAHQDPFPSLADLFYLLDYPLTLVGLLLFPYVPTARRERITLLLDLGIVMTTCAMVLWYFILAPLSLTVEQTLEGFVAVSYPVADLLILAGVLALVQCDLEKVSRGALTFLALGILSTTFSDVLFAYLETHGVSYSLVYLNIGWLVSILLFLFAGFQQLTSKVNSSLVVEYRFARSQRLLRLALPYLSIGVGLGLLLYVLNGLVTLDRRFIGLLYGALILVSLVLLRQFIVLRENVHLYEEMKNMASTDSLTGLYNRHFFNEVFRLKIEHARRAKEPLSILLMDVNGFKKINDSLGHLRGDTVLKTVAQSLAGQTRSADLVARFGGDEFIVILPGTDQENAGIVSVRIKDSVARHTIGGIQLSVSIGIAALKTDMSAEQFLDEADKDLYLEKNHYQEKVSFTPQSIKSQSGVLVDARGK